MGDLGGEEPEVAHTDQDIYAIALDAHDAGFCVIPIRADGTKKPPVAWKGYQSERPTRAQVETWFADHQHRAAAVVCGAVSGGLLMIEMEGNFCRQGYWARFEHAVVERIGKDRWRTIARYLERSPSGGVHLYVRCEGFTDGNEKLARSLQRNSVTGEVSPVDIMETRGEGGYSIIAGSTGHKTGNRWTIAHGQSITEAATVTRSELDLMLEAARTLDEVPPTEAASPSSSPRGDRPDKHSWMDATVSAFNESHGVLDVISGWVAGAEDTLNGQTVVRVARLGSHNDFGATIYPSGRIGFFSSNAPEGCQYYTGQGPMPTYDAFTLALLGGGRANCTKDRVEFALELRKRGYGPPLVDEAPAGPPTDTGRQGSREQLAAAVLPETLWQARPVFGHIRTAAHSRIRSADLVLYAVLARLSAYTDHSWELPPLEGAAGSLNFFVIAVGPSGAGKTSGAVVADELLPRPPFIGEDRPLGSGEGLAENYIGVVEEQIDGKKQRARRQVRHNIFVVGDEGAAMTEMMNRKGSTLGEAVRRAWTGGTLGQSNGTEERTRVVAAGMYRLGMLIGFQPEVAAKLMADKIAGTPQRFLFASAIDPTVPDPDAIPTWPGPLRLPSIPAAEIERHQLTVPGGRRVRLGVDPKIEAEVRAGAVKRARGQSMDVSLDSHKPLHLLKTAGMLAILDGRLDIQLDDWDLAHTIYETSCGVRASVEAAVRHRTRLDEATRIERNATRERAAQAARAGAAGDVVRCARRIAMWVWDQPAPASHTRRDLGQRLNSRDRDLLDPAIGHALDCGWLDEHADEFMAGGSRPE